MPYARNAIDGTRVYFEDDGGSGAAAVFHGGFLDSVQTIRGSRIAEAVQDEFRLIYVDHRGLGSSDKPHDQEAYAMHLRVADAVAVIDELGIQRAHFIGLSWGGRLGFGIGAHAPERVLSLIIGGQQPYAWPDSPLTRVVSKGLRSARRQGMEALVREMEAFWGIRFPEAQRTVYLANDPVALASALGKALSEGAIANDLKSWRARCLIFMGDGDADFVELARQAADEIPTAEFQLLGGLDHIGAHLNPDDLLVAAVMRTLRGSSE